MCTKYMYEHNDICVTYRPFNSYLKNLYLILQLTIIPVSLILLHNIIFENIIINVRILYSIVLINMYFILFGVQFMFALYSQRLHKMCKKLSQLQWRINGWPFRMRFKLKLLIYFERLNSSRRLGMSIGPIIVMTFPVFAQVLSQLCKHISFIYQL